MIDEKILIWKFNRGSKDALRMLYEKYKNDLLGLAVSLLRDRHLGEDVVHDVFVSFAQRAGAFRLKGSVKGYLSTCVANLARDRNRLKRNRDVGLDEAANAGSDHDSPAELAAEGEQRQRVQKCLGQVPYEQREVIVLHLHQGMRFREIAEAIGISINTAQSRYRYGLEKIRSILENAEAI